MRSFRRNIFVCLAVLVTFMVLGSMAFARPAFEETDEIPPYGATGDPGGTKLTGVMFVCYENVHVVNGSFWADGATLFLRLQREKSTIPTVFYGAVTEAIDFSEPDYILTLFADALEGQVELHFFGGANMIFKIKCVKNEAIYEQIISPTALNEYVLVDVELAAK